MVAQQQEVQDPPAAEQPKSSVKSIMKGIKLAVLTEAEDYERKCELQISRWVGKDQYQPCYNINHKYLVPAVVQQDGVNTLYMMRWGVPRTNTTDQYIPTTCTATVKDEECLQGLRSRRCVVPCNGFYHWRVRGKQRYPHFCEPQGSGFVLLAGLYSVSPVNGVMDAFSIITQDGVTPRSVEKKSIQPVVLSCEEALVWLNTSSVQWNDQLNALLPDEAELGCGLNSKQVGKRITTSRSNSPSLLNADIDKKEGIKTLIDRLPPEPRTPTRTLGALTLRPSPSPSSRSGPFSIASKQRSAKRKRAATSIDSDDELPPGPAPPRPAKRGKQQNAQNGEAGGAQRPSPERMDVDAEPQHNAPTQKGRNARASGGKGKGRKHPSPEPDAAAAAEPQPWPPKRTRKKPVRANDVDNVHAEGGGT